MQWKLVLRFRVIRSSHEIIYYRFIRLRESRIYIRRNSFSFFFFKISLFWKDYTMFEDVI